MFCAAREEIGVAWRRLTGMGRGGLARVGRFKEGGSLASNGKRAKVFIPDESNTDPASGIARLYSPATLREH